MVGTSMCPLPPLLVVALLVAAMLVAALLVAGCISRCSEWAACSV